VKAISYAKVKTDRVDARMLARLLRAGVVPAAHMIGAEHRETRDLRSRLQLVTRAVRCRHAVGSLLEKYDVPTPDELPELARMPAAVQEEQRALIRTHVRRVVAVLKERLLPTPDVQRLVWVPGIGKLGAYALVLEIDDIQRYPTVRHFHSYCRLVPGADNSAGKTRHKRSRDGNRYLKQVFTRRRSGRRSTTRRSGRSTGGWRGGRGRSWRGRSSRKSWRASCTGSFAIRKRSMTSSGDTS
jgi:transposase